ncbi:hypothetical protein EV356DRAFT_508993 [Viridothelium virens]|uniref:DUF4185 domain-containing protein n=1 Tax=Viridothelium virens TaxID=1048519 RepID=A0A6A6GYP3_VIRVR|nr:hypothetical protein EV356DRAFT_508993 [Viridothelium virens]
MGRMRWPPRLVRTDVLGEVKDVSGRKTPRDIGRTVWLGGNTYYIFGDTFCFDDKGDFLGARNNTIAYVPDPLNQPTASRYLESQPYVSSYVPHTESEEAYENDPEHKKNNDRVTCWSFGGIIQDHPGSKHGWMFFDKMLTHGGTAGHHFGMGVCRVSVEDGLHTKAERIMGDRMVFGEEEPRFGSISHLCDDDGWVYLLGGKEPNPPFDMRNLFARIRRDAVFTQRENYEFWVKDGEGGKWAKDYSDLDELKSLGDFNVQAQGAIIKCPELAPEGKPYMWFGVNKFMASHLYVGCAPVVTGPWDVQDLGEIPKDPDWESGPRYALYPNPQASNMAVGEMLCTWSDGGQMGGKVLAARFWFDAVGGPDLLQSQEQSSQQRSGFKEGLKSKIEGLFK